MRTVKIQGGLGNQLFGLAFAHSVVALTSQRVAVDLAAFQSDRYGHAFVFDDLVRRLSGLTTTTRPLLASRIAAAAGRIATLPGFVAETAPPASGSELARLAARRSYFCGYWQDEAYIAEPGPFKDAVRADVFARVEPQRPRDLVIHFRTYKDEIHPARNATPDPAYFRECIERLRADGDTIAEISLISDDPMLALAKIGDIGVPITPMNGGTAWSDMAVLMRARRLVLTNSSFSWWGGFCGEAARVFYPTRAAMFHYPRPAARFEVT